MPGVATVERELSARRLKRLADGRLLNVKAWLWGSVVTVSSDLSRSNGQLGGGPHLTEEYPLDCYFNPVPLLLLIYSSPAQPGIKSCANLEEELGEMKQ